MREMQRILLVLAGAAIVALPMATAARADGHATGYLVVRNASAGVGATGNPVVTVVVHGFVIGQIAQEGSVEIYAVPSGNSSPAAQVGGTNITRRRVTWGELEGTAFSGSGFRFRAVGGVWRVVVRGAGISLYAGGEGPVSLHGSSVLPRTDGQYSFNGEPFVSLPTNVFTRGLAAK